MATAKEVKEQIVKDYKAHDNDTGSSRVQIALLTQRINELTEHLRYIQRTIIRAAAC
jgi:small subunit ribosomal protein S15